MAKRKNPRPAASSRLKDLGTTRAAYGRGVSEAAAERGLSGGAADLFAQEAWAEMGCE